MRWSPDTTGGSRFFVTKAEYRVSALDGRDDLTSLIPDRATSLILIKTNVCRILEPKLTDDGFNVLNRGRVIYFPPSGRAKPLSSTVQCRRCGRVALSGLKACSRTFDFWPLARTQKEVI